jgi:isoleucyl-tRNA synthetase
LKIFAKTSTLSVHLNAWPKIAHTSTKLEETVSRMLSIIVLVRQLRQSHKIKVKIPLASMTIIHQDAEVCASLEPFAKIIQAELNVKTLYYDHDEASYVKRFALPNLPRLGKRLGAKLGQVRKAILALDDQALRQYQQAQEMMLEGVVLSGEDLLVQCQPLPACQAFTDGEVSVVMDTVLTSELIQEGLAREVINRIQKARKHKNFHVSDRIVIEYDGDPAVLEAMLVHQSMIKDEVLANIMVQKHPCNAWMHEPIEGYAFSFELCVEN